MSESFTLDAPDHFTAGTIGPTGQRVFFLQARQAGTIVTLKCEKEHVNGLAEYLAGMLPRLPGPVAPAADEAELLEPPLAAWDVGSVGVGYDEAQDRIVIVATEAVEEETEAAEEEERAADAEAGTTAAAEAATARFAITRAQAAAFVTRARALVRAGRPICPMCGRPRDPDGHVCPRANGHAPGAS